MVHTAHSLNFSMKRGAQCEGKRLPWTFLASSQSQETERLDEDGNFPPPYHFKQKSVAATCLSPGLSVLPDNFYF